MGESQERPKDLVTSNWGLGIRPKDFLLIQVLIWWNWSQEYIICPDECVSGYYDVERILYFCKTAGDERNYVASLGLLFCCV